MVINKGFQEHSLRRQSRSGTRRYIALLSCIERRSSVGKEMTIMEAFKAILNVAPCL